MRSAERSAGTRLSIVLLLVAAMVLLHHFAAPAAAAASSAMLALGFVVLASYAVGQLVEVVKLPHITGYLLAGMLLGPSLAELLPSAWALPPFDRGILSRPVIESLSVLDALAVALIALTAGGELDLAAIRRSLRTLGLVLAGQALVLLPLVVGLVYAISGAVPELALPGLPPLSAGAALALAAVVASIAYATSPAATIAVIKEVDASGPMTRTVLSSVVLKDVVVVLLYSIASALAADALGLSGAGDSLGTTLLVGVGGSVVVGAALGAGVAAYVRWVGREVLLFLVAIIYSATLLARALELAPVLMFISTGLAAASLTRQTDLLLDHIRRLSLPVYVVFFTLAGARLHLEHLVHVAPFALALFGVRAWGMRAGLQLAARAGALDPATERHGWLGYISQAGVALSLAAVVGQRFGEAGQALETLIVSVIALNELVGPVLLKLGLTLAGEARAERRTDAEGTSSASTEGTADLAWPAAGDTAEAWGPPAVSSTPALVRATDELEHELRAVVRRLDERLFAPLAEEAEGLLGELRQEFLRFHRRLAVDLRTNGADEVRATLEPKLAELALRWRALVLGRAAHVGARELGLDKLVDALDRAIDQVPEVVLAPFEDQVYALVPGEPWARRARRAGLRARRRLARALGTGEPARAVRVRSLALFHVGGRSLTRAEGVAALLARAEVHLVQRIRSVFEAAQAGARALAQGHGDATEALRLLHTEVEEELALARQEVRQMHADERHRAAVVLGEGLQAVKREVVTYGAPELPAGARRTTRVFAERVRALEVLGPGVARVTHGLSARYGALGLELELYAVEAKVHDALSSHAQELARDVRGRTFVQMERVLSALLAAEAAVAADVVSPEHTGESLGAALREHTEDVETAAAEGARAAQQLREQLVEESSTRALLDALRRATRELTDRYEVPRGALQVGEWRLPRAAPVLEVAFRELATTFLEADVAPRLIGATREAAARVAPLAQALQELERWVAFHNELARGELELVHDQPVPARGRELLSEMFSAGLARQRASLALQRDAAAPWGEALAARLGEIVYSAVAELRAQLVDGELSEQKLRLLRGVGVGRLWRQEAQRLPSRVDRLTEASRTRVAELVGSERWEQWREALGLSRGAGADPVVVLEPPRPRAKIPVFYGRLFASDTLEAGDVLTGREASLAAARRALSGESAGRLRGVALVGLDGVGKGTLSAAIVRSRSWKAVRRYALSQPATRADVDVMFRDRTEGHLVVVSGFHWLVSLRPGGLSVLRRFVEGVMHDGGKNAFLVHADRLVWDYVKGVAPLEEAFPEVIDLAPMTAEELEAAMLARHALSGFGLDFERTVSAHGLLGRGRDRPHAPYFRALHAASGGLVRDALRLWLASVESVDEDARVVHVGAVPPAPLAALRGQPDEVLVRLYQVARQGWMDAEGQAYAFRVDRTGAEAQLSRLAHRGLLERDKQTYRIASHLRGPTYRVLAERGWL